MPLTTVEPVPADGSVHELCPSCIDARRAWLDYRIVTSINIVQIGRPTVRLVQETQRARYEDWRATVTFQQNLITRICATKHQRGGAT